MNRNDDYYKLLQVHYLAEPEVIEGAYKRLVKKYHPDVSRIENSEEMMKKINQAYEVLSNPERRKQYNREWKDENSKPSGSDFNRNNDHGRNIKAFGDATAALDRYLKGIMDNRFDCSYELISYIDRRNISRDDFISWQNAVSKVFLIKEYSCRICTVYKGKQLGGHTFSDAVEFGVNIAGYNNITDMAEKDTFTRITVLENGKWHVYLGYEDLKPVICKFKSLTGLFTAKSVLCELAEAHSRSDCLTGLLNRKGIAERIESEILRHKRYGNVFSLIICDIDIDKTDDPGMKQEITEHAVKFTGEVLSNNLRKLDAAGRWEEKSFLILLPETRFASAVKAAQKISRLLRQKKPGYEGSAYGFSARLGTAEYEYSLEESLDRINHRIGRLKH